MQTIWFGWVGAPHSWQNLFSDKGPRPQLGQAIAFRLTSVPQFLQCIIYLFFVKHRTYILTTIRLELDFTAKLLSKDYFYSVYIIFYPAVHFTTFPATWNWRIENRGMSWHMALEFGTWQLTVGTWIRHLTVDSWDLNSALDSWQLGLEFGTWQLTVGTWILALDSWQLELEFWHLSLQREKEFSFVISFDPAKEITFSSRIRQYHQDGVKQSKIRNEMYEIYNYCASRV
jgi:hypothetical protein